MQPMITSSNTGSIPANLKIPPLESSSGKISMTPGTPTPELEAAAPPRSPPCLKMRRSHPSSMQTDKIPTLSDLNSVSRRLFPQESNHEDEVDDNVDSMSIDGISSEALLATPPRGGSSNGKRKMGPPQPRPLSFLKVDTCCHKTIPRHVTPPTSSASHHAVVYGAPSSSCSMDFFGCAHANSAFAANSHGRSWKKRIV